MDFHVALYPSLVYAHLCVDFYQWHISYYRFKSYCGKLGRVEFGMWFTYTQKSVSESYGVKLTTDFLFPALCSDNLVHTRQDREMQLLIENVLCEWEGES
jgi:hypothetical protein